LVAYKTKIFIFPYKLGLSIFSIFGYSASWGTRQKGEKGGMICFQITEHLLS
jgi:hypothetical protein